MADVFAQSYDELVNGLLGQSNSETANGAEESKTITEESNQAETETTTNTDSYKVDVFGDQPDEETPKIIH